MLAVGSKVGGKERERKILESLEGITHLKVNKPSVRFRFNTAIFMVVEKIKHFAALYKKLGHAAGRFTDDFTDWKFNDSEILMKLVRQTDKT